MATINPYLNFRGNCEEAFEFYKSVFGGKFEDIQRFKDTHRRRKCRCPKKKLNGLCT